MGRLDKKIAVITGAAMGNGLGIAEIFAKEGATVVMLDINEKVHAAADGLGAEAYQVDIRDYAAVKKAVDETAEKHGRIDILVNNAGVVKLVPFLEMIDETRDFMFTVNINGTWNCTKAVVPYMVKASYGKIVNLSSVTGTMVADPGESAYATTKAAIWGFTKALAMEFVDANLNVNMICPGMIRTPMVEGGAADVSPDDPEAVIDAIAASVPMKRLGTPKEIGQLAAFLASDEAAYITGQPFVIDGGSTLPETNAIELG